MQKRFWLGLSLSANRITEYYKCMNGDRGPDITLSRMNLLILRMFEGTFSLMTPKLCRSNSTCSRFVPYTLSRFYRLFNTMTCNKNRQTHSSSIYFKFYLKQISYFSPVCCNQAIMFFLNIKHKINDYFELIFIQL